MTRADLKHCGKIPEARDELNRSVREGRIESIHSIKSWEGLVSSSHDLGAECGFPDNMKISCNMIGHMSIAI